MEKKSVIISIVVCFLGFTSAVLAFAAEAKRIRVSQVTEVANGVCAYPRSPAYGLGITSALSLLLAQILINVATGCICCRTNPYTSTTHWTLALLCFALSWFFSFFLLLFHGTHYDRETVRDVMKFITDKKTTWYKLEKDSTPIVELLLEKDPSVAYWQDEEGLTPPLIAATPIPSYVDAIDTILQYCPESIYKCDRFGNTILHLMTQPSVQILKDAIRVMSLLRYPQISALKNKRNNDGNTPIFMVSEHMGSNLTTSPLQVKLFGTKYGETFVASTLEAQWAFVRGDVLE